MATLRDFDKNLDEIGRNQVKVCIIILNMNSAEDTLECLESLLDIHFEDFHVVVVDNGSVDGSQRAIRDKYSNITLIENNTNLGFAGGNNQGIKYALQNEYEYILLLNNDVLVDKNFLGELVKILENDRKVGIVGPKIYYAREPSKIWFAGGLIDLTKGVCKHIGKNQIDEGQFEEMRCVDYITGCALMSRADVFRKVGLLDEGFFPIYYEDADFCLRARAMRYKCVLVPRAKIWHKVSSSAGGEASPKELRFMTANLIRFMSKHRARSQFLKFSLYFMYGYTPTIVSLLLRRKLELIKAFFDGVLTGLRGDHPKSLNGKTFNGPLP